MNRLRKALGESVFAALGIAITMAQVVSDVPALGPPSTWVAQVAFTMALWFLLSLGPALFRSGAFTRAVCACLRFVLYKFIVYPIGGSGGIAIALLCVLVAEATLTLPSPADRILPLAFIALALVIPSEATAWDMPVRGFDPVQMALLAFVTLTLLVALWFYKAAILKASNQAALIDRLKKTGLNLIDTNIMLQERVVYQARQILTIERSRISRELHDTIGYTLMNILAMQKAAEALLEKDPERAREFIVKTMQQSERGLSETRAAIGSIRSHVEHEVTITEAVTELSRAFKNTHIHISTDLINSAPSYGRRVDKALSRFVQEAITNAIKHGNADEIIITFWRASEGVTVTVQDNGSGIQTKGKLIEGIGLRGMRERLGELGGWIQMGNDFGGFKIIAFVPDASYRTWM